MSRLEKEQELELGKVIKRWQDSDKTDKDLEKEATEAVNTLFNNYQDMAYSIALNLINKANAIHYAAEDAQQDALLELYRSLWYYDPSKKTKAGTFVYSRIWKAVSTAINDNYIIRLGNYGAGHKNYIDKLRLEWGNLPEEERSKISEDEYILQHTHMNAYNYLNTESIVKGAMSLDAKAHNADYDTVLHEVIEDESSRIELLEEKIPQEVLDILKSLPQEERSMVLSDIGYDCEKKFTSKQKKKVYDKIRKILEETNFEY